MSIPSATRTVAVSTTVAALGLLASACGPGGMGGSRGDGPEHEAVAFQRAWTAGSCTAALKHVARPDQNWRSSCRDAFRFSTECEELGGSGDPRSEDCGPGTRITVRSVRAVRTVYDGERARVRVRVRFDRGVSSRRERTVEVTLRQTDSGWRVTSN